MTTSSSSTGFRLRHAAGRVAGMLADRDPATVVAALSDDALLALLADAAHARDAIDLTLAAASAEVARRSTRELGYRGLAQRKGHRNVTSLVQNITGQTRADVGRALRTGQEFAAAVVPDPAPEDEPASVPTARPWNALLRDALACGRIGQAQFQAIRVGLGEPPVDRYPNLDPEFLPQAWAHAVELLLAEAADSPVEELRAASRIARDRLDPIGVTMRFEERFEARSFRTWIDEHGQRHGRIVFDDDAIAWVDSIMSASLRPRRGPRFVEPGEREKAAQAAADERTNEQLQYDTLIAVLRAGAAADPQQAFGDRQPGVRIIVEAAAIDAVNERGHMGVSGVGHLEHSGAALPGGVIEKYLCDAGAVPIQFDSFGRPLDVGREKRLFTAKQRIAIAVREGGCIWTDCTAPAEWCEYHHINHWWADHGSTDVDDGVPLCRNCHLRLHNQGWRITRTRDAATQLDTYWLHPPPDPETGEVGQPIALRSKSPLRFEAA